MVQTCDNCGNKWSCKPTEKDQDYYARHNCPNWK